MAENINIDFMPNRKTSDIQRVTTVEDYLKLFTDRTKFCFASVYDDFADMGKRIENLESFSLATPSSLDLTVENAVILQEKESQQVIHNFTETNYVKGNKIGYGGVGNSIVCDGYLVEAQSPVDEERWYSSMTFSEAALFLGPNNYTAVMENVTIFTRVTQIVGNAVTFSYGYSVGGDNRGIMYTRTSYGNFGIAPYFNEIIAPNATYKYGAAGIIFTPVYYDSEGVLQNLGGYGFQVVFSSEAEYNAAVGLTNTPIELIKIQDFQCLVPESQIIVDKELSPDSDNVIANSAVAKALAEKADKVDVQSISLAVKEKAESSDLTAHTDDKSNPHEVTKEQIGLGSVENKSSADILSELSIGGTQILRGTNTTTTLGAMSGGTMWETGSWRIASSTGSGIYRESIVVTDAPNANIKLGWKLYGGIGSIDIAQDNVPVASGNTYTLSCYARGNGVLRLQYGKNPYVAKSYAVSSDTIWDRYSMTFVANETEGAVQSGLTNIYFGRASVDGDSIEICGMKLELGNKVTDWSPAPEDMITKEDLTAILTEAVSGKAESSDLTVHTTDISNPHKVTKEQIGLDKAENKSASEILSELSIGGTQILRNTQTTTLAGSDAPALWSEGAWRKASGANGTWESIDVTDCPEPYIEKGWRITSNSATISISQNNIPLVVGEEYILSVYAKGKGRLLLNTVATAGGGSTTSRFDIDSEKWEKFSHIFTAQSSSKQSVYIGVNYQGDSIDVCGMKLEIGNRATSWNICPKDIADHEDRIKALEAAILSLGGET